MFTKPSSSPEAALHDNSEKRKYRFWLAFKHCFTEWRNGLTAPNSTVRIASKEALDSLIKETYNQLSRSHSFLRLSPKDIAEIAQTVKGRASDIELQYTGDFAQDFAEGLCHYRAQLLGERIDKSTERALSISEPYHRLVWDNVTVRFPKVPSHHPSWPSKDFQRRASPVSKHHGREVWANLSCSMFPPKPDSYPSPSEKMRISHLLNPLPKEAEALPFPQVSGTLFHN